MQPQDAKIGAAQKMHSKEDTVTILSIHKGELMIGREGDRE